jgi:hypothetical protein
MHSAHTPSTAATGLVPDPHDAHLTEPLFRGVRDIRYLQSGTSARTGFAPLLWGRPACSRSACT